MKIISIRSNDHVAKWIMGSAQQNRLTISEFIRELLYEKMEHGQVVIKQIYKSRQFGYTQNYRHEMGYIIFTAKLIEQLMIMEQRGEELRDQAFAATTTVLEELNLNSREQRLCVTLESSLREWLGFEAVRLQIKVTTLIRKLIEQVFFEKTAKKEAQISDLQKIALEHQIRACKLLESIVKMKSNAASIIEDVTNETNKAFLELFPE